MLLVVAVPRGRLAGGLLIVRPAKLKPCVVGRVDQHPAVGIERARAGERAGGQGHQAADGHVARAGQRAAVIVRVLPIVDAAAIDSVPPEIVSGSVDVRLLIESVTLLE